MNTSDEIVIDPMKKRAPKTSWWAEHPPTNFTKHAEEEIAPRKKYIPAGRVCVPGDQSK